MSLFTVDDWAAPATSLVSESKPNRKRKRSTAPEHDEVRPGRQGASKPLESADWERIQQDVEDKIRKLEHSKRSKTSNADRKGTISPAASRPLVVAKKHMVRGQSPKKARVANAINVQRRPLLKPADNSSRKRPVEKNPETATRKAPQKRTSPTASLSDHDPLYLSAPSKREKKEKQVKPRLDNEALTGNKKSGPEDFKTKLDQSLTKFQHDMKQSLEGARFRHINELLYKTSSDKAVELVRSNPSLLDDYHSGFRHQVKSWPVNPVDTYITQLESMGPPLVIADLGCGEATIAKRLVPKGYTVLSYDLKSDGHYIIEADICQKIPLPGSETDIKNGGQIVDVVICALSLMSTNWVSCIREAWRILKVGGSLKIAEVTSRVEDIAGFAALVVSIGFVLRHRDGKNTHFMTFDFQKIARRFREDQWKSIEERGKILKP